MNVAAVRDSLERTGVLFTQNEGDVGHISDFWRSTILSLCDALEAAPTDVADLLRKEKGAHAVTKDEVTKALAEVDVMRDLLAISEAAKAKAEDDLRAAVNLVAEAVPRM